MKIQSGLVIIIIICLNWFHSPAVAQDLLKNFSLVTYNAEFEGCSIEYDSLYRIPSGQANISAKFLLQDKLFTGCARTDMNGKKEKSNEYFIGYFENGYPVKQLYFYNNGDLSREFNFKNGKSHGKHIMYYEDGSKYIEECYEDGKEVGAQKRWYKDGKTWRNAYYSNGIRVFDKNYDHDGKEIKNGNC